MISLALRPFRLFACFRGRSSRLEFWLFFLLQVIVNALIVGAIAYISHRVPSGSGADGIRLNDLLAYVWFGYILLSVIPFYAVVARRFRDLGQSGWMCLVLMIPMLGPAFVLLNMLRPGQEGENLYGAAPQR
ncbi:DUF805 domain-containing protein [Stenotrophomonas indicatrix]|uniref:DUF805 domain-containing protein n=1 Tax=Stenotrophomonas indicatrix TaxID=2045451 RepID=UPI0008BE9B24|nr:DUF805 domain-containing protein [Stenotrophomonas indicatrix]SET54296.1 Uncharacterized membrane protein YhaH, DUF805 family [Stenotrophomonas indicatrix]